MVSNSAIWRLAPVSSAFSALVSLWRRLLPGAVIVSVGLVGLRLLAGVFWSPGILHHNHQYGPLGIIFMIFSWCVAFSGVVLGGAPVGHLLGEGTVVATAAPSERE